VRSITISPTAAEILRDHLERFSVPGADGLVFPNAAGNPLSASSFQKPGEGSMRRTGPVPRLTSIA
jgi:hypothetical protein